MLMFFFLFATTDYFQTIAQYQIAQHLLQYYLERTRVEGWLSPSDGADLTARFDSADMDVQEITIKNQGNQIIAPLQRNTENPVESEIELLITAKPKQPPLTVGLLIGASAPDEFHIKVGGMVLSEYVP